MNQHSIRGGRKAKLSGRKNKFAASNSNQVQVKQRGQDYAKVIQKLGECRFRVTLTTGQTCLATLRGKLQKKLWVNAADIVLVAVQDFQTDKVFISHRYTSDDVRWLIEQQEIDPHFCETGETSDDSLQNGVLSSIGFEVKKEIETEQKKEEKQEPIENMFPNISDSDSTDEESAEEMFFNPNRPCQ